MAVKTKGRKAMIAVGIVLGLLAVAVAALTYIPVERAIYPEDLGKYDNVIVIQYGLGAPTDYMVIGDSTGLFGKSSGKKVDVYLLGEVPPNRESGIQYGNDFRWSQTRYVCFAEYKGKQQYGEMGLIDTYEVASWVPLAPIHRGGMPPWMAPKGYTCYWDVLLNTVGRRI